MICPHSKYKISCPYIDTSGMHKLETCSQCKHYYKLNNQQDEKRFDTKRSTTN